MWEQISADRKQAELQTRRAETQLDHNFLEFYPLQAAERISIAGPEELSRLIPLTRKIRGSRLMLIDSLLMAEPAEHCLIQLARIAVRAFCFPNQLLLC